MSNETGNDINEISRKPGVTFIDSTPSDGNGVTDRSGESNGGIREPEILTFRPETIRFGTGGDSFADSADGLKRTRRGTIDRRTRAGRGSADAGTATQETAGKSALASLSVADLLISINGFLATITEVPEFEIDGDEAKALASAIQDVGKHYTVSLDPKKVAWANLAAVVGKLGWTRVLCYRLRKSSENEDKVASPSATPINQPKQQTKPATADHTPKQQANGAPTLPSQIWDEPAADNITPGL